MFMPERLRAVLVPDGADRIDLGAILGWAESDDLDFKREGAYGLGLDLNREARELRKREIAKDIAAMANANGGLIIIGIEEAAAVADRVAGTADQIGSTPFEEWVRPVAAQRLAPLPRFDVELVELEDPSDRRAIIVAIPPSTSAPHAVIGEGGALHYPIRHGSTTNMMSESEVEGAYERRRDRTTGRERALDSTFESMAGEFANHLLPGIEGDRVDVAWLIVAWAPETPGAASLGGQLAVTDFLAWLQQGPPGRPRFFQLSERPYSVRPDYRSVRVGDAGGAMFFRLFWDGGGAAAIGFRHTPERQESRRLAGYAVSEFDLTLALLMALEIGGAHAAETAHASGPMRVTAQLRKTAAHLPARLTQWQAMLGERQVGTSLDSASTERSLSACAIGDLLDRARIPDVAYPILMDIVNSFGMAEPRLIAPNGQIESALLQGATAARAAAQVEAWLNEPRGS